MNIGICLTGVSYSESGKLRDFRRTYQNFFDMFYTPLLEHHNVSIYTTTYSHKFESEFLDIYKPKKNLFLSSINSNSRVTYINGLCLIEEEPLDLIISTRFDILFCKKITDMDIDYSKFNFLFKEKNMWDKKRFVTDNLFIFPMKYLYSFYEAIEISHIEALKEQWTFMLHNVYDPLLERIGKENIHIISPSIQEFSHDNSIYKLDRTEI